MGDVVFCKLLPIAAMRDNKGTFSLTYARLKDDLTAQNLELGQEYRMVGVVRGNLIDVWHVAEHIESTRALLRTPYSCNITLPPAVASLYKNIRDELENSPWGLSCVLASQLCADIIPESAMLHLKYGLILSLATLGQHGVVPAGVAAVGRDSLAASYLMKAAGRLADRCVVASGELLEGSMKMEGNSDLMWGEAGDLILAAGGICLLGDWAKHRRAGSRAVSSLETGFVTLQSRLPRTSVPPMSLPLRAAVWTYWGDRSSSAKDNLQLRTLIDVFGMPFLSSEGNDSDYEQIVNAVINRAKVEPISISKPQIPQEELKQLLRIATALEVHLTPAATDLIKDYFVASRRERPGCLPQNVIQTITSLSKAHARLSLREVVLPADVALVIFLYQQSISALFGASQITGYAHLRQMADEPIHSYMHRQMQKFTEWLEMYVINL